MGFCSRVVSTTTNPDRQEAHNGHFSTFTTDTEQPFQDNPPAIELYYCRHVCNHRTSQRFYYTVIPWAQVFWAFFCEHLLDRKDSYLLAGDECVITKAGEKTHGLDCFFSGLLKKTVPGLSFFAL